MDRRSFLIGASSILTTAYLDKANWYLRNKNAVVPLVNPDEAVSEIFFVNNGYEYSLLFDLDYLTGKYQSVDGRLIYNKKTGQSKKAFFI